MKLALLATLAAAIIATTSAKPLTDEQYRFLFTKFVAQYDKQYEMNDFFTKFNTFKSNLNIIVAHNAKDSSYKLGVNQFADLNLEEFSQMMGFKPLNEEVLQIPGLDTSPFSFPEQQQSQQQISNAQYKDWTETKHVAPVQNQGSCGSCWAFAVTAATESASSIKKDKFIKLSEQWLLDCDNTNSGCSGGLMERAMTFVSKQPGFCAAEEYDDYSGKKNSCKPCQNSDPEVKISGQYKPKAGNKQDWIDSINRSPFVVGLAASSSAFQFYKSGILNSCTDKSYNHAVFLTGIDADADGNEFYRIRNSWGASWGEEGYIRLTTETGKNCGTGNSGADVQAIIQ